MSDGGQLMVAAPRGTRHAGRQGHRRRLVLGLFRLRHVLQPTPRRGFHSSLVGHVPCDHQLAGEWSVELLSSAQYSDAVPMVHMDSV